MSWHSGSSMFIDFWPLIQQYIPDRGERVDFTADLLKILVKGDMDPWAVEIKTGSDWLLLGLRLRSRR